MLVIWCALLAIPLCAQPTNLTPDFLWAIQGNGRDGPGAAAAEGGDERVNGVAVDSSGNVIVVGDFLLNSKNLFVVKYDRLGNVLWRKTTAGPDTSGWGVAVDGSDNIYVLGSGCIAFDANTSLCANGFIVKFDSAGNPVWAKGTEGNAFRLAVDQSGNAYLAGAFTAARIFFDAIPVDNRQTGSSDVFVAKYDNAGHALWARSAGGTGFESSWAIAVDNSGNAYLTGVFNSTNATFGSFSLTNNGAQDIFVAKYDTSGNVLWAKSAGGSDIDSSYAIAVDNLGNAYVSGTLFLAKYDTAGNIIWVQNSPPDATGAAVDAGGNLYLAAGCTGGNIYGSPTVANCSGVVAKFDPAGAPIWVKQSTGSGGSVNYKSIAVDTGGTIYVAGFFGGSGTFNFDSITLTKTNGIPFAGLLAKLGIDPPTIVAQPQSQTVVVGSNANFSVFATGRGPFSYQWRFNLTNLIAGATNTTFSFSNAQPRNVGNYDVVVSNFVGAVTSQVATLTVQTTFTKSLSNPPSQEGTNSISAAWGDYDGDGYLDLVVANSRTFDPNPPTPSPFLYRNDGNGGFAKITNSIVTGDPSDSSAVIWADYDNDGKLDLFFCGKTNHFLYRNAGNGSFTKILTGSIVTDTGFAEGAAWADYDKDGLLDLFVSAYGDNNLLYHNVGNGTFNRVMSGSIVSDGGFSQGCAWGDYDNDGYPDLFVANYGGGNFLYHNNREGSFTKVVSGSIATDMGNATGCAWGDYDNDGYLDLFVCNYGNQTNFLYHNNGNGTFSRVLSGVFTNDTGYSDGCAWVDYDNDGFLDLFVANISNGDVPMHDNFFYRNNGDGTFTKLSGLGVLSNTGGTANAVWGDYDNDGFPDVFLAKSHGEYNALFRNNGNSNQWVKVKCIGVLSNRSAIGAKIRVNARIGGVSRWQLREISGGSGNGSQNSLEQIVGLGDATNIDVLRIEWPSGIVQTFSNVAPRQFIIAQEQTIFSLGANGAGLVTSLPAQGGYFLGQAVTLIATPRANWWRFLRWSDGVTNNPRTISVGTSNLYIAVFTNLVPVQELVSTQWQAAFGGTSNDTLYAAQQTSDGGFVLGGFSESLISGNKSATKYGGYDFWVVRLNGNGSKLWDKSYGGSSDEGNYPFNFSLGLSRDAGFILGGTTYSGMSGNKSSTNNPGAADDGWAVKIDSLGAMQWDRDVGGDNYDSFSAALQSSDGGYLLVGDSWSAPSGTKTSPGLGGVDGWVVKLNPDGSKQWENSYGGVGQESFWAADVTSDGGFILAGTSNGGPGNHGDFDFWLVRIDASGSKLWEKSLGGSGYEQCYDVKQTSDGGYILVGTSYSGVSGDKSVPNFGNTDLWIIKVDADGNKQWDRAFGGAGYEGGYRVRQTGDGGYITGGSSGSLPSAGKSSPNYGGDDFWVVRLDASGNKLWEQTFGGSNQDMLTGIVPTSDGYLLAGASQSGISGTKTNGSFGGDDFWAVKLAVTEDPVPVSSFSSPTNGAKFTALGQIAVNLSTGDFDGFVSNVNVYATGPQIGTNILLAAYTNSVPGTNSYSFTWSNVVLGSYTLAAVATDNLGVSSTSAPVNIEIVAPFFLANQGSGTVTASPARTSYQVGESVTLTATPRNTNWTRFLRWSDGNTNNPRTVTVGTSNAFTAVFTNMVPLEVVFKQWDKSFGGTSADELHSLQQTADGGFILGGSSLSGADGNKTSPNFGSYDYWVVRLDANGNKLWDRSFGGTDEDQLTSLQQTSDGGFIVGGYSRSGVGGNKISPNFGLADVWVVRLDASGNKLWERSFGNSGNDAASSVRQMADGGFVVGGISGSYDFWVVRLDANGNMLWNHSFGGTDDDEAMSLELTVDGGFIAGGYSSSGADGNKTSPQFGAGDFWAVRLDANGTKLWEQSFGGASFDNLKSLEQTDDGGFILSGYSYSDAGGNKNSPKFGSSDGWVVRVDANGNRLWDQSFGGAGYDDLLSVQQMDDGGFILGGSSLSGADGNKTSPQFGGGDGWLVGLDANGSKRWDQSFGGTGSDILNSLQQTRDGGFVLGGFSSSTPSGNKSSPNFGDLDFWVVKLLSREAPVGTPLVLVNGRFSPTNSHNITNATAALIEIQSSFSNAQIYYTLDGSTPSSNSVRYAGPFAFGYSAIIRAVAYTSNLTAFAEADPVTLSVPYIPFLLSNIGSGSVTRSPETNIYVLGQQVTLTATPRNANWTAFLRWSDGITTNPRTITVGLSNVFTAIFTNFVPLETVVLKQWETTFGGSGDDYLYSLQQTSDGGYILGGWSSSGVSGNKTAANFGRYDNWLVKVDANGTKQWERSFGGTNDDYLESLQQTSDGGYILGGWSSSGVSGNKTSANFGGRDFWVVKVDANGNKQWEQSFGGSGDDYLYSLRQTSDGGYILGGASSSGVSGNKTSANYGDYDNWLIKVNANGSKQWEQSFGGGGFDDIVSLQQTSDSGYILGGASSSGASGNKTTANYGDFDDWVVKVDFTGNKQWEQSFGGGGFDDIVSLQQTSDSGYILGGASSSGVSGNKTSTNYGTNDFWVVRVDASGNKQWEQSFGGSGADVLFSLQQTSDGGYILGGQSSSGVSGNKTSANYGSNDFWVVKVDASGNKQWERGLGGSENDSLFSLQQTSDGGYILGGTSSSGVSGNKTSANYGSNDFWVVKFVAPEVPIGTPLVLVNGQYSPSNYWVFNATNAISVTLTSSQPYVIRYRTNGSDYVVYDGTNFAITATTVIEALAVDDFENEYPVDPVTIVVLPLYSVTASTPGGGTVSLSPAGGTYESNSTVTLTASNLPGWTFLYWTGSVISANATLVLTNDRDRSLQAIFGAPLITAVTPAASFPGYILRQPDAPFYAYSNRVRLTGVPTNSGRYFARWTNNLTTALNPDYVTITNPSMAVTGIFSALTGQNRSLTVIINGNGSVTKNPQSAPYNNNQVVTNSATPDPGNVFTGWSGDENSAINPLVVTMTSNKIITANFAVATNFPPIVSLTNPPSGATFTAPANILLQASATDPDGTVVTVKFYDGATLLGTVTNAPYNFTWTNAPTGSHSLTAVATDNGGLSAGSSAVNITVNPPVNQPPLVSISTPTNGASFAAGTNITISGSAADTDGTIARVEIFAATTSATNSLGVVSNSSLFSITWSNVPMGSYSLTTRATDNQGATTTSAPPVNIFVVVQQTPATFHFAQESYSVNESNGSIIVTVVNDGTRGGSVNYSVLDGTAVSGPVGDYTRPSGTLTLTFADGETSKTLPPIPIRDDTLPEANETFQVQLQPFGGGEQIGDPSVTTITIIDNDPPFGSLLEHPTPGAAEDNSGRLRVTTVPDSTAQWRFPWELGWRASGVVVTGLVAGDYEIVFRATPNYRPIEEQLMRTVVAGQQTEVTNAYFSSGPGAGWLTVSIDPNVLPDPGWRFIGETNYLPPGTLSNLVAGSHFIEFKPNNGWTRPQAREVKIFAGQGTLISGNYLSAPQFPPSAEKPFPLSSFSAIDGGLSLVPKRPYVFNGELHTDAGYGSGVAVREKVVLTAAHMIFNDRSLSYARDIYWFFQRHAGQFDPKPIKARGAYVFSGYAVQRTNDLMAGVAPGESTAASRELDAAAVYFAENVARGGYGGYLVSDASTNEWLTGGSQKMLIGYPVEGTTGGGGQVVPGIMHRIEPANYLFSWQSARTYTTPGFLSFPGNSGGPLYVLHSNGFYYPAAIYLGSVGNQSIVRSIDSNVVNLINLAANVGDSGTNFTGGGVILITLSGPSILCSGYAEVRVGPPSAVQLGGGWRVPERNIPSSNTNDFTSNPSNYIPFQGGSFTILFKNINGFLAPTNRIAEFACGQSSSLIANYTVVPPRLSLSYDSDLSITGTIGTRYRIEQVSTLGATWTPLTNVTLNTATAVIPNTRPSPAIGSRFYRAVWLDQY